MSLSSSSSASTGYYREIARLVRERSAPPVGPPLEVYQPFHDWQGRFAILYGGAGSGKSFTAAEKIVTRCLRNPHHRFLALRKVRDTIRHSVFEQIEEVCVHHGVEDRAQFFRSTSDVRFSGGAEIISAGLDDRNKLKSIAGITGIWIEEATEITQLDFSLIDDRLRGDPVGYHQIILTFNPIDARHWIKARFVDRKDPAAYVLRTVYTDNPHHGYDADHWERKDDENERRVFERGEWGLPRKGLIYPDATTFHGQIPEPEFIGVDFGFARPTAIIGMRTKDSDEGHFLDCWEIAYRTHMDNTARIEALKEAGVDKRTPIYCDSAEPERVRALQQAGFNAVNAIKDVSDGIDTVQSYKLRFHSDSRNLMDEALSYTWAVDRSTDMTLDKPSKSDDHGMDAIRYGIHSHTKGEPEPLVTAMMMPGI